MFYIFAVIFGFSQGLLLVESPIVADLFGLRSHGVLLGIIETGYTIGTCIGPFSLGYMFDIYGNYHLGFLICAALGIFGLVFTVLLRPIRGKRG